MTTKQRVSVVDDEPRIRTLLQEVLEEEGLEVKTFPDGPTFLEDARAEKPDLVLLDINMPRMNGWEVKESLDEDADLAGTPVIAVTAQGGRSVEASAREGLNFDGFLRKPFDLDELLSSTRTLLEET